MDPCRLSRDELEYELRVRGVKRTSATVVVELRKALNNYLKNEKLGELVSKPDTPLIAEDELTICTEKINSLRTLVINADSPMEPQEYKRITTKLCHLFSRVARVETNDPDQAANINTLQAQLEALEAQLLQHDPELTSEETIPPRSQQPEAKVSPTTRQSTPRKQIPVAQWKLSFTGDGTGLSVNAFIERVEEYRISRNVSLEDLYNSAVELFQGCALVWFRSVRSHLKTWTDLVSAMRSEFEPYDYDIELWKEIRARTQGPDERIGNFFACLQNLFSRLPIAATEEEKLQVFRRNIDPYFIHSLGLSEVRTVDELLKMCKRLEANRYMANKFQAPSTSRKTSLEPDLAYQGRQRTGGIHEIAPISNEREVSRLKCWNCARTGHRYSACTIPLKKFCFSCGKSAVTKATCPHCQRRPKNV